MEDEIMQWCPTDPITCKECGKIFDHPTKLTRHQKIHSNRKQRPDEKACLKYFCLYCEKVFASRNHLSQHAATHTSRKEYPCDFCNARFGSPSFLNTHKMLLHKGRKLPMKEHLSQNLASNSKNEMKSYSVKKQHKCTVCGSDFALESSLARHMCLTHQLDNGGQFHEHITFRKYANRAKIPNRPTANAVVDSAAHTETNSRMFVMSGNNALLDKSPSGVRIASALEQQSCRNENLSGCAQNDMYGSDEHAAMLVLPQHFDANNDTSVGLKPSGYIKNNNIFPFTENSNAHIQNNDFSYGASEATFLLPDFIDANDDSDIDQKPFVCKQCGAIFSLKANLDEHMTAHVENAYHSGREGTETSTDICTYSVEPIEQKPYRCDICGEIFPLRINLEVHRNEHTYT